MREGLSRLWTVPVLVLFCAPLFVGLGNTDLQNDEAIYSFAVDSILETGDWLNPRSSPNIEVVFLEKPPLKFWIVALPIRLGLLPHDEFGIRFWDAFFGAIAFAYVFALGRRLAGPGPSSVEGPICGLIAVLVLFTDPDLVFEHGLRNNNMEAPLVLCYCGAVYHFLAWGRTATVRRRRWHAAATGFYFFLGFMTKFVAALFLPAVLVCAALCSSAWRGRLREDVRLWAAVAGGVAIVAAPWFVYQLLKPDSLLWEVMFAAHVYMRFTTGVDPTHLQPWSYYFVGLYRAASLYGAPWFTALGAVLLIVEAVRVRRIEAIVILLWFVIPVAVMTLSSSKLYHYAYPVMPPIALATGYGPARLFQWTSAWLRSANVDRKVAFAVSDRWRTVLTAVFAVALFIAVYTLFFGPIRVELGPVVFRNRSVVRPIVIAVVAGVLAARASLAVRAALLVLVAMVLPLHQYRRTLERLPIERHPWRTASACLADVASSLERDGQSRRPVYAAMPETRFLHPYFYYMRRVGPWERVEEQPPDALLHGRLHDASAQRPMVIADEWYQNYQQRTGDHAAPMVGFGYVVLIMPGPYAACSPERR